MEPGLASPKGLPVRPFGEVTFARRPEGSGESQRASAKARAGAATLGGPQSLGHQEQPRNCGWSLVSLGSRAGAGGRQGELVRLCLWMLGVVDTGEEWPSPEEVSQGGVVGPVRPGGRGEASNEGQGTSQVAREGEPERVRPSLPRRDAICPNTHEVHIYEKSGNKWVQVHELKEQ